MSGELDKTYSQTASSVSIKPNSKAMSWEDTPELFALDNNPDKTIDDCLDHMFNDEKE